MAGDSQEAVKIAGEWTKQLALWATGTLVLSLSFLKDFLKGQEISGGWLLCLVVSWVMLILSVICGHLAFGAPLTGAEKDPNWSLRINNQTRWLSGSQLVTFVGGLAAMVVFAAFHISGRAVPEVASQPVWEPAGCVGPFISGITERLERSLSSSETIRCGDIPSLAGPIQASCRQSNECLIVLVGSADKQPLSSRLQTEFGSNEGLARARAEWVREQLVKTLSLDRNRFVVLTTGPREHGKTVAEERLRFDRAVQVYIFNPQAQRPKG